MFAHVEGVCPCASYTCSLNTWAGRRVLCMFAHVEGVCDTPLQFLAKWIGDEQKLRKVLFN